MALVVSAIKLAVAVRHKFAGNYIRSSRLAHHHLYEVLRET